MRPATLLLIASFFFGFSSIPELRAEAFPAVSSTNENTLNDLVRRIPNLSPSWERELRHLSAVQEQLYVFEREMRGEGLTPPLSQAFSIHYSAIINAMVEDRITGEYGRDLLSVHRQLLAKCHEWSRKRIRDENFPVEVIRNLHFFLTELQENALPLYDVPASVRTPVVNGYQVWLGELIAWGCECGGLTPGAQARLRNELILIERFEGYYKADGLMNHYERELLHERFLNLTLETIEIISR